MKVRDKMNRRVLTVNDEDDLALAVQMMAWAGVHHLPVVHEQEVVGLLSEHDIFVYISQLPGREGLKDPVARAMTAPVQTAHPDDDFVEAAARMATETIGCLPVVEHGQLVGILTVTDIVADRVRGAFEPGEAESVPVSRVMTIDPLSATADELLLDAVSRMSNYRVRHLPVIDGERRVIGILADRDVRTAIGDLRRALSEEETHVRLQLLKVADVMSREVAVLGDREPLFRAIDLFLGRGYGAVPVVDAHGRLVGIVSYIDALRQLAGRGERAMRPTPSPAPV